MITQRKILENKKAAIPSTLVWIVGTILILVIMIIYLSFSIFLFVGKSKPSTWIGSSEEFNKATMTDLTLAFLESSYSESESISDFISRIDPNNINQEEVKALKIKTTALLENLIGSKNPLATGTFYIVYLPKEGEDYKTISEYSNTLTEKIAYMDNRDFGFVEVPVYLDKKIIVRVYSKV